MGLHISLITDVEKEPNTAKHNMTYYYHYVALLYSPLFAKAGVLEAIYNGHSKPAGDIVEILCRGVADMKRRPEGYKNLGNILGRGSYEVALEFLSTFSKACRNHPEALAHVGNEY